MRLGQTSAVYFGAKTVESVLGFLAMVYFARVLGEEVIGHYSLILAVVAWIALFGNVGFTQAIIKRVSEGDEPSEFIYAGIAIKVILLALMVVVTLTFSSTIDAYVGTEATFFVVFLLVAKMAAALVNAVLQGSHLVHLYGVAISARQLSRTIFQVALVYLGFELTGMIVGYGAGALLVALVAAAYVIPRPARPTRRHVRSLFDYAKFSWLGSMRVQTFKYVDIIVLGIFVPAGLVGIYTIAYSIAKVLDVFGLAISKTLFPEMSERSSTDGATAVAGYVEDSLTFNGLFIIPGLVGSIFVGDLILAVYGPGFVEGEVVLPILVFAVLIYAYNKQLLNALNSVDRPDLAFRANSVFIGSNVLLNVVLVYFYGWVGAAVATGLSAGLALALSYRYATRVIGFDLPLGEVGRQLLAAAVMGGFVYLLRDVTEPTAVATHVEVYAGVLVVCGAGVYLLALYLVSPVFRETVSRNLPFDTPVRYG